MFLGAMWKCQRRITIQRNFSRSSVSLNVVRISLYEIFNRVMTPSTVRIISYDNVVKNLLRINLECGRDFFHLTVILLVSILDFFLYTMDQDILDPAALIMVFTTSLDVNPDISSC